MKDALNHMVDSYTPIIQLLIKNNVPKKAIPFVLSNHLATIENIILNNLTFH